LPSTQGDGGVEESQEKVAADRYGPKFVGSGSGQRTEYRETRTFEQLIRGGFQGFGGIRHPAGPDLPKLGPAAVARTQSGHARGPRRGFNPVVFRQVLTARPTKQLNLLSERLLFCR
jgi:hypothetical protein